MIVIFSAVFPPEPVVSANLSYDIASVLSMDNNVTVISPKPSRPFGFQFADKTLTFNFDQIQVGSYICASSSFIGRFRESYSFGRHCYLYVAVNHQNIDVIYANTWPLMGQYFAVKAAHKYDIPIIMHVQDVYPESLSKKLPFAAFFLNHLLIPLDKYILSKASKVIVISRKMKDYLVKSRKLMNNKIRIIPNWQDEQIFIGQPNQSYNNEEKPFKFMYLGNISPAAGVDLLIHSFHKSNLDNAQLIVAGSGSDREYCMKIANQYENINIQFIDAPSNLVPSLQATANVLMLPLKKGVGKTASPSKLPAYMFSKKPIIACVDEDSDTSDVIRTSNCGWVLTPENIDLLSALMQKVSSMSKELLIQKGQNGFDYAIQNFSKKNNLQKIVNVITETCKK